MARSPKSATIEKFADAAFHTLDYVVPTNKTATAFLVVTNLTMNTNVISVYINNGIDDFLLKTQPLAAGVGKSWRVLELSDLKLNSGFSIKVKASNSSETNYFLSVSEIS